MRYKVDTHELHQAMHPHELFLINLIFNHVLLFIAFLSVIRAYPALIAIVPTLSLGILGYTLWRARRALERDPWFTKCHWQIVARRSIIFIGALGILTGISLLGWLAYQFLDFPRITVLALIGGFGILPTLVTVLALIIMESDALHQAKSGTLPAWLVKRFPDGQYAPHEQ